MKKQETAPKTKSTVKTTTTTTAKKTSSKKPTKTTKKAKKSTAVDYNEKVVEVKNLKKHFIVGAGKNRLVVPAVDNVSFDIHRREAFGLVGESGCGKTTTGRTIIRLYKPTDGYVKLNGIKITAGIAGNKSRIKQIKQQAQVDIIRLYDDKNAKYEINEEYKKLIIQLNHEIVKIKKEKKRALRKANSPIEEYKKAKYELNSEHNLILNEIRYQTKMKREAILDETRDLAAIEYKKEMATAKNSFIKKEKGLKDSEALTKEEIKKRIASLKIEFEEEKSKIQARYDERKIQTAKEKPSKEEVRQALSELNETKKRHMELAKKDYEAKRSEIVIPEFRDVLEAKKAIIKKYNQELADKEAERKNLNLERKAKIQAIEKFIPTEKQKIAIENKRQAIIKERDEKIAVEQNEIKEAKNILRSPEIRNEARRMQMIFQDPISSLNPRMTVGDIIAEGLIIRGGFSKQEIQERVKEVLHLVGLSEDYITRYPHEFSGGQRQRIGVARALIMDPNFIIADEPISALDVSIRAQVINLLSELKAKLGLTILFIAHDLSVVRFLCDNIAVMYYGKIVEKAPTEELFAHPMHPYTKSLLSAIPQPDPDYEKGRVRIGYDPRQHNYLFEKPEMHEIAKNHWVYCNQTELEQIKKNYKNSKSAAKKEVK